MKRILILIAAAAAFVGALETPAHSCPQHDVAEAMAVRLMHMAVDISTTVQGEKADRAVNALMDLVELIDKTKPEDCR